MISPEVSCEQKALFLVYCSDGCSGCSTRTGEIPSSGRPTSESDYRKRKRRLFVCEQRGDRCGSEDAGRKLLLQTNTRRSQFWPTGWSCGRRFLHVLLASLGGTESDEVHRKNQDLKS